MLGFQQRGDSEKDLEQDHFLTFYNNVLDSTGRGRDRRICVIVSKLYRNVEKVEKPLVIVTEKRKISDKFLVLSCFDPGTSSSVSSRTDRYTTTTAEIDP